MVGANGPIQPSGEAAVAEPTPLALKPIQPGASRTLDPGDARPFGTRELVLALVACAVACFAVFGLHIVSGGRYLDDWWLGGYLRFPHALGYQSAYGYLNFYSGARPGAVAYWLGTYALFGFDYLWHRALGVVLAAALALVFYALLRELRIGRRDAAAITALSIALPIADSIRFWITPDVAELCLACCAGGLLLALRGFEATGRRRTLLHLAASAMYVVSMLIAETTVPVVGLSVLVYRARVPWRAAAKRWAPDAALAAIASIHYLSTGTQHAAGGGASAYLHHAAQLGNQALTLLAGTVAPFASSRGWVLLVLVAIGALVAIQLRSGDDTQRSALRRWARIAVVAGVLAAASYVIYVPSDPRYLPLVPGIGNRVNIGALLPLAVLAYAIARLIGCLIPARRVAGAVTTVVWALMLIGALIQLEADRALWDRAASEQALVLGKLHRLMPRPPAGATLIIFGAPGVVTHFERVGVANVNVSVPVFSTWWEMDAAVKLSYGRSDVDGYPVWAYQRPQLACGPGDVYQLGLDGVRHVVPYGDAYVVDLIKSRSTRLLDQRQCANVVSDDATIRFDLPA